MVNGASRNHATCIAKHNKYKKLYRNCLCEAFNLLITLLKRLLLFQRFKEIIPIVKVKPMQESPCEQKIPRLYETRH